MLLYFTFRRVERVLLALGNAAIRPSGGVWLVFIPRLQHVRVASAVGFIALAGVGG